MENQRKKRKLMSSRSVPGTGVAVVAGCGVLINGDGGGGGGGGSVVVGTSGGVARGVAAMAAVRGRTLTRTGQRASQDRSTVIARQARNQNQGGSTQKSIRERGQDNFGFTSTSRDRDQGDLKNRRKLTILNNHKTQQDPDKENAVQTGTGTTLRNSKRGREKEGDGNYADLPAKTELHLRSPKVTALRMAKNVGESRIPMPGNIRSSFLPKPKVVPQKVTGISNLSTPQQLGNRGTVKSLVETLNLAEKHGAPVTSTPFVGVKTATQHFLSSPVESISCEDVGQTVCVGCEKVGILRYYGALEGKTGAWCGIELSQPDGLNDGTVRGFRYFTCPQNHGVMAPAEKVRRVYDSPFAITPLLGPTELKVNDKLIVPNSTFVTGQHGRRTELICPIPDALDPSPGAPAANSTILLGRNDAESNPGGDWKLCLKSTPNTSPASANNLQRSETATGGTNEITNDTRVIFDDKNKRNSTLIAATETHQENPKTSSPTSKTKIPFGSRLVSPTTYGKNSTVTISTKNSEMNVTNTVAETPKSTNVLKRNGTSPTNCEAKKSLAKINEALLPTVNLEDLMDVDEAKTKSTNVTYRQEEPKEQAKDVTIELSKGPTMNTTVNIFPSAKPTGAVFKLNESFINEKPLNGNTAANLTTILYGDRAPVAEIPFSKKLTYLCGKDNETNEQVVNATFGKPGVVAGLPSSIAKQKRGLQSSKDFEDTFLVEKKAGQCQAEFTKQVTNDTFSIENKMNGTYVCPEEKSAAKPADSTFSAIPKNHCEINDTFFVRPADRRSTILSGNAILEISSSRDSIGSFPSMFDDSKLFSQIESVGDSCLIDTIDETENFEQKSFRNVTVRQSVDNFVERAFHDSKASLIDAIGDSCLIDNTLQATMNTSGNSATDDCMNNTLKATGYNGTSKTNSGPYSLLGLNGPDEDDELTPPAAPPPSKATPAPHYLMLNKQNSFEHDESLGILTPDQMAEFSMALECSRTPSCENLTGSAGSRIAMTRASASRPSDLPTSVDCEPTEGSSERTPSPEDLPLDPKPAEPTRTVPVSFITSVTSITSLEAGYQGDGENSRPASRGADPAPVAPPPNLPAPRTDPMTDSDFFTESDADAHEEIGRGDRRAQVIDGTLFCAPGGRRCPSFTGEEMDSSGIYSDLDRRQDEQPNEEAQSEGQTPDTADTESLKSQPSPHQQSQQQIQQPVIMDCLQVPSSQLDSSADSSNTSAGTLEATVIEVETQAPPAKTLTKSDPVPLKKYKMPKRNVVSKIKAMIESGPKDESEKEARRPQRIPRKGGRWDAVMSKIEAGKNEQRTRPARKEVKSRVLQNLGPPPTTSNRRSPGDSNKSKSRRNRGRQDVTSPMQETAQSSVHSSMSDISSAPRSAKKRLGSPGGSEGSAQSTPRVSSPRQQQPPSSLTIVNNVVPPSTGGNINNNNTVVAVNNGTNNNNNNANSNQRENSTRPIQTHSQRSPTAVNPPRRPVNGRASQQSRTNNSESKKNSLDVSRVNLEKSPSAARKPAVPRRSTSNVAPKTHNVSPAKDRGAKESIPATRGPVQTREQAHQTDPTREDVHLKQAEVSVQALSVIVQYLAHQLDGFSAPRLKKDCERMKTEWLEARLEAEELRAGYRRVEQQLTEQHDERQRALDQLRTELESRHACRLTELETALNEEREKCEARLQDTLSTSSKELQVTIARLRTEHEADLVRKEAETDRRSVVHDQGAALRAEAESLRTVLELRSQEITALRAENDNLRREVEIKEALEAKVIALEARSEDLKAQLQRKETFERQLSHENKVLLESFHQESKQNKRLSQHNEELQWRLRQNNEVVTVLANQLATPPQRLTRSLGPELSGHSQSPDDSPPASPMVKSMVEKSDSVSWTLEIEESPEAMASRLLRRSGSSRGISPSDSRPKRPRQPTSSPVTSATVSRQSSLRTAQPQRSVVLRTRSKSVSVADAPPTQEQWAAATGFTSTPSVRRRPRSDPAGSPAAVQEASQGLRPQEAGGEAMISEETSASSSSEDESSASSDIPRLAMELSWSESEG